MKKSLRIIFLATMIVFLFALPLAWSAQAAQSDDTGKLFGEAAKPKRGSVVSVRISAADQQKALRMWTHEAIAAAPAMEMPAMAGPAEVDASVLSSAQVVTNEPSGMVAGSAPDATADQVAQAAFAEDWAVLEQTVAEELVDDTTGTPGVYTAYTANWVAAMQTIYPHRWIGRVSFSTSGGTSYCSGTALRGNVMLTAAHCLYDTTNNVWYSNWVFTPAYRNGSAPYGSFPATTCWVLTAWVNLAGAYNINTWAPYDVGVCRMGNNAAGQTLNTAVGSMGYGWGASYIRHVHNLGYPFRDYNNNLLSNAGLYLRTCAAETFQQAAEVRGMGCYYGGGISGGPWMTGYAPGVVSGYAHGVNSGIFIGSQNIYGARFNNTNIVPLCSAAGC